MVKVLRSSESRRRPSDPAWVLENPHDDFKSEVKKKKREASRGMNYCNDNAQSTSTNRLSSPYFSMISNYLPKVEKQLQNKQEKVLTDRHDVPNLGKENSFTGSLSLSSRKTLSMGRSGPVRVTQITCNREPELLFEFLPTLVTSTHQSLNPSASYTKAAFFETFEQILNKLNSGNVEKLYQELLISVGPDDTFAELTNFIFSKAINEVDSPTTPTCYAQLMGRACNNANLKNLSVELRKASINHFSELFDAKEPSSTSFEFQHGEISISRRSKGILRFIGELFKVDIIPLEDMKSFVDRLVLHPDESNLNHLCHLIKLTGSLLETKSNTIENGIAENLNSNQTHMPTWFEGVCAELERKKESFTGRIKLIMEMLELRDGQWIEVEEPPNIEIFLKPSKDSGGGNTLWRETQQQSSIENGIETSCADQQSTLFPVSSDDQPMAYNQEFIDDNEEEETVTIDSLDFRRCHICNRDFSDIRYLIAHNKNHEAGLLPCGTCGQFYPTEEELTAHMERHVSFRCEECSKSYTRKFKLQCHVDFEHKGISRFVCEICDKRFQFNTGLRRHLDAHANPNSMLNKRAEKEEESESESDDYYPLEPHEELLAEAERIRLNEFCSSIKEARKQRGYQSQFLVPLHGNYYSKSKKGAPLKVEKNVNLIEKSNWTGIALIPVQGEEFGTLMCISKNVDPILYIKRKMCASLKSKIYKGQTDKPCIGIRDTVTKDNYKYDYNRVRFINIFCSRLAAEDVKRYGVKICKNTNKMYGPKTNKVNESVLQSLFNDYMRSGIPRNFDPLVQHFD